MTEVGYDDLSGSSISNSKYGGVFYSGGFHWTPSPDLDLRLGDGRRSDSNTIYALGDYHLGPRTVIRISQQTGITTNSQSFAEALESAQRDATGAFINPFSGLAANPNSQIFSSSSSIYRQKSSNIVLTHTDVRDTFTVTLQYAERQAIGSSPLLVTTAQGTVASRNTETGAIDGQWSHQLTPALSGALSVGLTNVLSSGQSAANSTNLRGGFNVSYLLNQTVSGTASFQHTDSWQNLGDVREESVIMGLHKAF